MLSFNLVHVDLHRLIMPVSKPFSSEMCNRRTYWLIRQWQRGRIDVINQNRFAVVRSVPKDVITDVERGAI